MNYIIFDLEFNQSPNKEDKVSQLPFEIIQIGALKLDENLKTLSTFNKLIKPRVYKSIHPYIQELTGINEKNLSNSEDFIAVYNEFVNFIGKEDIIFVIWGTVDLKELYSNILYFNLPIANLPKLYIDIQDYTGKYFKFPSGKRIGLKTALDFINVDITKDFHNAFNDAYYTAEIFKKLYSTSIKSRTYSHSPTRAKDEPKKIVDYNKLILQMEKMFNRKLTPEEIKMVKLSYNMGRTNQFLISIEKDK